MRKILIFKALLLIIVLSACSNKQAAFESVTPAEAKKLLDQNEVVVLDVRTPEEFEEGHIPNAILIPLQELENRLNEIDKNETYLVVCRSGNRSAQASEILVKNGFSKVYNMSGGMNEWTDEIKGK